MRRIVTWVVVVAVVLTVVRLAAGDEPSSAAVAEATATATATAERATPRASRSPRATTAPTPEPTAEPTPVLGSAPTGPTQVATVASVTDGDTIRVLLDGQNVPVRYIGIDTPETQNETEWMGHEATDANAGLVAGREVVLEKDVSETDQYGRLLRHVWVETDAGWLLVSLELLRLGVAEVRTYPPDVKYVDELFLPAQRAAREQGVGLWGTPPTAATTPAPIVPLVPGGGGGDCEASYPDICIPIGSADRDCGDLEARRFTVLWDVPNPDPHRFDADGDGIGCEG